MLANKGMLALELDRTSSATGPTFPPVSSGLSTPVQGPATLVESASYKAFQLVLAGLCNLLSEPRQMNLSLCCAIKSSSQQRLPFLGRELCLMCPIAINITHDTHLPQSIARGTVPHKASPLATSPCTLMEYFHLSCCA